MHGILLILAAALPGMTEVWTETALVNVYPDTEPTARSGDTIRLFAARGERESFQICIRGGRSGFDVKEVRAKPLRDGYPPPDIRRVAYLQLPQSSPRADGDRLLRPDPLLEMEPFTVPPRETRALWVTYEVPRDARPGLHRGTIEVVPVKGRLHRIQVTLEVYDMTLPEVPTLRTAFPLNREAVAEVYGLDARSLEDWQPVYDALGRGRISYGLWSGTGLVAVDEDGAADTAAFKEHLEYAVTASNMNAIDIGSREAGTTVFPAPPEGVAEQDPLQVYLHDMDNWLQSKGWLSRAFVQPLPPLEAAERQETRREYFRVWRADQRIDRLVVGTLHPSLERYTDVWAVPVRYYQPFAQARLLEGESLKAEPAYPAVSVNASSAGGAGEFGFIDSTPEEAYDGSLFTSWVSAEVPGPRTPQWLRIDLEEPVQTRSIRIGWKPGLEPSDFVIKTSIDGRVFNNATTRFSHHRPVTPFDESWSEGRFKSVKTFRAVWLHFPNPSREGPIGITEVEFGLEPDPETVQRFDPLEIWTYSLPGDFPSLYADAHPAEARLFPWVCRGHNAGGMLYRHLTDWPVSFADQAATQPGIWTGGGTGEDFLFYPGREAPIPSLRSERLRDGIEDFEYLIQLREAMDQGLTVEPATARAQAPRVFPDDMTSAEIDDFVGRAMEARQKIGAALTGLARKGTP